MKTKIDETPHINGGTTVETNQSGIPDDDDE